jgi:hypothetical protein
MTVTDFWYQGMLYNAAKYTDESKGNIEYDLDNYAFNLLLKCAILCNKAYL